MENLDSLFEDRFIYPDPNANRRFQELGGINNIKSLLVKSISVFLKPKSLEEWGLTYHKTVPKITGVSNPSSAIASSGW